MEKDNSQEGFLDVHSFDIYKSKLWIVDYIENGIAISTGVSKTKKVAEKEAKEKRNYAQIEKEYNPFLKRNVKSLPQYQSLIDTLLITELQGDYEFFPFYYPESNETFCIVIKTNELMNNWQCFSNSGKDIPGQIRDIIFEFYKSPPIHPENNNERNIKLYQWLKLWYARLEVYKG